MCSASFAIDAAAITEEERRLRVLNNAKSEENRQKRLLHYEGTKADCNQKIAQYQHVSDILDLASIFSI